MKERKQKILNLLQEYQYLTIKELANYCCVSLNTVRSDISELCVDGVIVKFHGGIMLLPDSLQITSPEISIRHGHCLEQKKLIGQLVAKALPRKDVSIFFDSSTTSLEVAKCLVNHNSRITAITNFSNIAQILSKNSNHSVILCGGKWLSYENCTIGNSVLDMINEYSVDYAILGCTAIDIEKGVYNGSFETITIKQKMLKNARETWLVCDDSKFDKQDLISMFPLTDITTIFTNIFISAKWEKYCLKNNIKLIY